MITDKIKYSFNRVRTFLGFARELGWVGMLRYRRERKVAGATLVKVQPRASRYPLWMRIGSSDHLPFTQIFVQREYQPLDQLDDVRLVLDCGANAGYASAYFLSRFPQAKVIAIEPDPGNFEILERNTRVYGQRIDCLQAGVWPYRAGLKLEEVPFRSGREWSRQVREIREGETADFPAIDIGALLAKSGYDRISILKMDIEGAETLVFSKNFESWIDRVDAIAVELHNDSQFGCATEAFLSAIEGRGFTVTTLSLIHISEPTRPY